MANLSDTANDTYIGGQFYIMWWEAGDSSHKCGEVIMDDNQEEVKICSTSGQPCGFTALQAAVDIDTDVTSGVTYQYYCRKMGTVLYLYHDTGTGAIAKSQLICRSDAVAGANEKKFIQGGALEDIETGISLGKVASPASTWFMVIT